MKIIKWVRFIASFIRYAEWHFVADFDYEKFAGADIVWYDGYNIVVWFGRFCVQIYY